MLPNERKGIGESYDAYEALLKAVLAENSKEMKREKVMLDKIVEETEDVELRDAMIIMQQDILNVDKFGENKKELEKSQMLKFLALHKFGKEHKEIGEDDENPDDRNLINHAETLHGIGAQWR